MTTIAVSPDTLERFDFYRSVFKMTSDELLNHLMDKNELANITQIRSVKRGLLPNNEEIPVEGDV